MQFGAIVKIVDNFYNFELLFCEFQQNLTLFHVILQNSNEFCAIFQNLILFHIILKIRQNLDK